MDSSHYHNIIVQCHLVRFGNETLADFDTVHYFILGMIGKPKTNYDDNEETDSVIMSYGVRDWFSQN